MDKERKQQLLSLLRAPIFNIATSDDVILLRYDQALTHSTYAKEQRDRNIPCEDNERMEFFGDCILDFLISRELYESFPKRSEELRRRFPNKTDEALLTDMLHEITNDSQLSEIVISLGSFEKVIRCGSGQAPNEGMRAGAFEAFIAAIFVERGIEKTRAIVTRLFKERITHAEPIISWKNKLQECVQKLEKTTNVKDIIDYRTRREEGTPDHAAKHISDVYIKLSGKDWEIWGCGCGIKGKDAEKVAAENAVRDHCSKQQ